MRSIVSSIVVAVLLLAPPQCYAQQPASQSNNSQQSAAKAMREPPPKVVIALKNGLRLKGRSYGWVLTSQGCRVEIVHKGRTQTFQCQDVDRIDAPPTFWRKVGGVSLQALGIVLFVPAMLYLVFFCRYDCG
jgi:hypothetical protein